MVDNKSGSGVTNKLMRCGVVLQSLSPRGVEGNKQLVDAK